MKLQRLKGEVDNPPRNKAKARCEHTMHRAALVPSASPQYLLTNLNRDKMAFWVSQIISGSLFKRHVTEC